ncbi:MAG TPA: 16S rRNA (cytidine(1402)-2'-O)-methyltransferase [Candidatus Paceibacterota bacterium]|nr:16S rRNA (cytidine(1402)-2'-O)-methyltransferase [Candidatus Paceibacterota bacterium]
MEKIEGLLSIVATPIGNLEDITLRALRVLGEADYVLCEDTRVTGKLLHHHGIKAKMKRYDAHASEKTHQEVLSDLESGTKVSLVSDAGTPGISDPGVLLVTQARRRGIKIETIPGASAVAAAFSIAGIAGNQFSFLGFVPQKKGRETFFKSLADYEAPVIFFESVHRIEKTLDALVKFLPEGAKVTVARELTKLHEEIVQGEATEVEAYFRENQDHVRGEFVVLVSFG